MRSIAAMVSAMAAMAAAATQENERNHEVFKLPELGVIGRPDGRQLREFNIKGQKIMAFSRLDAIKRLKHQK